MWRWSAILTALLSILPWSAPHCDEIKQKIERPVEQAINIRQQTQQEDEQWRELKEQLTLELERLQAEVDQLQIKRDGLVTANEATRGRVQEKEIRLADIRRIEAEVEPFLGRLIADLKALPQQGLPFLMEERKQRIAKLEKVLSNPDITLSEKFRKAMEALQIEMEYGLTIETYQEQIELQGQMLLVNMFRLGRLGLYFQSLDHRLCGTYNPLAKKWERLPDTYNHGLQSAIEIAAKRRPAEIVAIPLGRMVQP